MTKLILADIQPIYRAGIARLVATVEDFRIVAQCSDTERMLHAITIFPGSLALIASSLRPEWPRVTAILDSVGSSGIAILEDSESADFYMKAGLKGVLYRCSTGSLLMECIKTVAAGGLYHPVLPEATQSTSEDSVGTRVRDRLTPKEMRIVALIVQGCKNREIATRLKTTEQVVKNYLRSIYDKTGVSDRLELALFTLHHRVLAEAASEMGSVMDREDQARQQAIAKDRDVQHPDGSYLVRAD